MSKKRVEYSDTFKAETIAKVKENNGNISQTAKELGIPMNTLANWHKKAESGVGVCQHSCHPHPNNLNGGKETTMAQYSAERKQAILDKLLSPNLISIAKLARDEHIAEQTLYNWRHQAKRQGKAVPTNDKTKELSPETKLTIIIDTARLNETELAEYCRSKGLYPEQIAQWKTQTLTGFSTSEQQTSLNRKQQQADQKQIKQLKQEIKRKDKALAEAAAILILRKKLNAPWGGRGRMTILAQRQQLITLIDQAANAGARLHIACSEVNISKRTYRRWKADKDNTGDKRPIAIRAAPSNKLSDIERQAILDACNEARFASLPPSQIVPTLLDEGIYHASESSFYRVLKGHNQLKPRGRAKAPNPHKPPETFIATKPCQVFCWDITYLPSTVRGQFYYLYMIEDVYSRKIVGFEVYDREAGDLAAKLLERTLLSEKAIGTGVILHSDNGAPMKSQTLRMKAYELGVLTSYSRPRVSNDNPFAEALFRTVKYAPSFPEHGFDSLDGARVWVNGFVHWYNAEHKHSGLNFVTPNERHTLKDGDILARRESVLVMAKQVNPARWNGRAVRNCSPVQPTALNPVRLSRRVNANEVLVA